MGQVYYDMGDFTSSIDYFNKSISLKEKLNDKKGLNSTLLNLGKAQIWNTNYQGALANFKRALTISNSFNDIVHISERYEAIGRAYFSLTKYDSAGYYLNKADSIFQELGPGFYEKRLSTLSWLAIMSVKNGQDERTQNYVKNFDEINTDFDPKSKDIISLNWNMYQVHELTGDKKSAKEYLENSYLEIRSRSKNIKNKGDRNQYLSIKLHQDITAVWNK